MAARKTEPSPDKPRLWRPMSDEARHRKRKNITLDPAIIAEGERMAIEDDLDFSVFVERLIEAEAERRSRRK